MDVMKGRARAAAAAAIAVLALSAPAGAQSLSADARWLPFTGCWRAVGGDEAGNIVCFTLEGGGVTLTSYVGGQAVSSESLVADGRRQQVSAEGCAGFESVTFSDDGHRVYTRTEFLCGTDEPRTGTGVMAFLEPNVWADIRTLQAGDEPFAWVQEYRIAGPDAIAEAGAQNPTTGLGMAIRAGRAAASTQLTFDDVIEASETIDEHAVEAWLLAKRDRFAPSGQDLLDLLDAGVPERVIDAVVAVSHPERFLGPRRNVSGGYVEGPRPVGFRGYMGFDRYWGPLWGLGFAYAPYAGWGYAYPYYGYRPGGYRVPPGRIPTNSGGRTAMPRPAGGSQAGPAAPSTGRQATPRQARRRPSGGS